MHKGLREPHLLLAGPNPIRLMKNLSDILGENQIEIIRAALHNEALLLYQLGHGHFTFAKRIHGEWRQKISRLYYAAYNVKRSITLIYDGSFSTESIDHSKVDKLPDVLPNAAMHSIKLKNLREDRNLADYSHLAKETDLIQPVREVEQFVEDFINDSRQYLIVKGMNESDF